MISEKEIFSSSSPLLKDTIYLSERQVVNSDPDYWKEREEAKEAREGKQKEGDGKVGEEEGEKGEGQEEEGE